MYSSIRIISLNIDIVRLGSEYIPHVKKGKFGKMHKPHAPTDTKNRNSEDRHIRNNKNNGNPIMMVANTKMELSELPESPKIETS